MTENLKIEKQNVLHTIGNVVLELATTVTQHFNYILINVKVATDKEYVRPVDHSTRNLHKPRTDKVAEWFKLRGISTQDPFRFTCICEGPEFMPQTGKVENTIKVQLHI